jgi:hypothetical protein
VRTACTKPKLSGTARASALRASQLERREVSPGADVAGFSVRSPGADVAGVRFPDERKGTPCATYPIGHPVASAHLPPLDLRAVDAASHAAYLPRIGGRPGRKGLLCGEKVG